MQKKIVALAVAGLSTAAFAQTNVTIYGVADISGQGYSLSQNKAPSKADGGAQGNVFSVQSNSSLIGFKGTEDLGNGLKALFQAETTLNLAGSTSATNGMGIQSSTAVFSALRDSYVGVNSKYGTGLAGYLSTPFRSALTSFDVMPGATGSGSIETLNGIRVAEQGTNTLLGQNVNAIALSSSIRATAIAYAMPTLYGFDGSIAYTGSGNNGTGNNTAINTTGCGASGSADVSACTQTPQSAWGMNLGWTGYGVNIKGAFQQANINLRNSGTDSFAGAGTAGVVGDFTSYLVGAAYTGIAGLKTSVVYTRNTLGLNGNVIAGLGASKLSNNQLYAGASYRWGNWEPRISATWSSDLNGSPVEQLGARQWTLNTGYYLSKRTQVYGLISNLNNSANQNYQMGQQANALKPTGGQNLFTYGMGMRTTF